MYTSSVIVILLPVLELFIFNNATNISAADISVIQSLTKI